MGFRKYNNKDAADLVHKIELFDFETGDPAFCNGRRQFLVIKGEKSRAYQNAVEREAAHNKRKGKSADNFTFKENTRVLARRLADLVVAAYVDVGDDEIDLIEFSSIDDLEPKARDQEKERLRTTFTEVTDLAMVVQDEVVKGINFLPGHGQSLSALLSNESSTEQPQQAASIPA